MKEAIEKIPFGDIKKLQGAVEGYRLRVGNLRVFFTIEENRIRLVGVESAELKYKFTADKGEVETFGN